MREVGWRGEKEDEKTCPLLVVAEKTGDSDPRCGGQRRGPFVSARSTNYALSIVYRWDLFGDIK